jgi:hypothetical protein
LALYVKGCEIELGEYTVTATMQHEDEAIVTLTVNGEEIKTTPWHLFYTDAGMVETVHWHFWINPDNGTWGIDDGVMRALPPEFRITFHGQLRPSSTI